MEINANAGSPQAVEAIAIFKSFHRKPECGETTRADAYRTYMRNEAAAGREADALQREGKR